MNFLWGNNILPAEILNGNTNKLTKGFSASVVRFFMMQAHYRSVLDFSNDAMLAAEKGFNRLMEGIDILKELQPGSTSSIDIASWKQSCYEAMNDDFNTPILIAHLLKE